MTKSQTKSQNQTQNNQISLAVILTGGKQYLVSPGMKLKIEKLPQKPGQEVIFDKILLTKQGNDIVVGQPFVAKAQVKAKVLKQEKGEKLIIFKYKPKKRYKLKKGHRQLYTQVEILEIKKEN